MRASAEWPSDGTGDRLSYVLIRPQAMVQLGAILELIALERGINVIYASPVLLAADQISVLCRDIQDPRIRASWAHYMQDGVSFLVIAEGKDIVNGILHTTGRELRPKDNPPGSIRRQFGVAGSLPLRCGDLVQNAVHKPNCHDEVQHDLPILKYNCYLGIDIEALKDILDLGSSPPSRIMSLFVKWDESEKAKAEVIFDSAVDRISMRIGQDNLGRGGHPRCLGLRCRDVSVQADVVGFVGELLVLLSGG